MLILTRKKGQKIVLYDKEKRFICSILTHRIRGSIVSLGITAPTEIQILREELVR